MLSQEDLIRIPATGKTQEGEIMRPENMFRSMRNMD